MKRYAAVLLFALIALITELFQLKFEAFKASQELVYMKLLLEEQRRQNDVLEVEIECLSSPERVDKLGEFKKNKR